MTLQELYTLIGGNYDQAQKVMRKERLIDKYVRKFDSKLLDALAAAGESMDPAALFESAHAMKGVCANLGLDELSGRASEIAEEFRPGSVRQFTDGEVQEKLAQIAALYQKTLDGIQQYVNG